MSRNCVFLVLLSVGLVIGSWALAQQERQPAKAPVQAESGPFSVSPAGQTAVLLDSKSGRTWVLSRSHEGEAVWLPAKRIDAEQQARDWQEREKRIKDILNAEEQAKKKQ